jgi:hypothetical protein
VMFGQTPNQLHLTELAKRFLAGRPAMKRSSSARCLNL